MSQDAKAKAFKVRIDGEPTLPGMLSRESVEIKNGPQTYKSATVMVFGNKDTGEIKRRELRVQSWRARPDGPGYDFDKADNTWNCDDDEIQRLQEFLNGQFPEQGVYQLAAKESAVQAGALQIDAKSIDPGTLTSIVNAIIASPAATEAVARMDSAALLTTLIERQRQLDGLERWRRVVEDPDSTEPDIQKVLDDEWWIFGGRYIDKAVRRNLIVGEQLDLALVRADGSLHVIEIKQANLPRLVVKHRGHLIVGKDVHDAVGQTMNYLVSLDEERNRILTGLNVDTRRASCTVVLGHPMFVPGVEPNKVSETLRTYSSHLSRIEVMTFADLINGAHRSLAIADATVDDGRDAEGLDP